MAKKKAKKKPKKGARKGRPKKKARPRKKASRGRGAGARARKKARPKKKASARKKRAPRAKKKARAGKAKAGAKKRPAWPVGDRRTGDKAFPMVLQWTYNVGTRVDWHPVVAYGKNQKDALSRMERAVDGIIRSQKAQRLPTRYANCGIWWFERGEWQSEAA